MGSESEKSPAELLVDALERIEELSQRSAKSLAETRQRADSMRELFNERISAAIEGRKPPSAEAAFSTAQIERDIGEVERQWDNTYAREEGFLDSFQALMRLYANPESRPTAEAIMDRLRQIRTLSRSNRRRKVPRPLTDFSSLDAEAGSPEERRVEKLRLVSEHHEKMAEWHQEAQAQSDLLIAEEKRLEQEALELARTLLPGHR